MAALPQSTDVPALPMLDFIALDVPPEAEMPVRNIRVELKRGSTAVRHWAVESASSCAARLHEWVC